MPVPGSVGNVMTSDGTLWQSQAPQAPALPANVALKDQELDLTGGSGTAYNGATVEIQTVATPRVSFHWPGVVASQIGMDSAGVIRTFDNPGTGYAPFAASKVVTNATGNNLGDLTVNGATNFTNGVNMTGGNFTGPGSIVVNGSIQSGAPIYPGTSGTNAVQASWYLHGHPSYGLYTNTGFYAEGGINGPALTSRANIDAGTTIRAGQGLYERGRGSAVGDWATGGVSSWGNMAVANAEYGYTMVGGTVFLAITILSCYTASAQDYFYFWTAWNATRKTAVGAWATVGGSRLPMSAESVTGNNQVVLRRLDQAAIPAGDLNICFCLPIAIVG